LIEKWANLLLEWASAKCVIAINIAELLRTPPFDIQRELLEAAINYLVKVGQAKKRGRGFIILYWRSPEEWAMKIYRWLKENFKEVFSIDDLIEAYDADFSSMPRDELEYCLKLLERAGLIAKLKRVKGFYKLIIPGVE